jgi:hypothetical protein
MNEEAIESIKNALREVMQLLAARGRPLTQEEKAMLARVMEHAANRIQELRSQESSQTSPTSEEPTPIPGTPPVPPTPPGLPPGNPEIPPLEPAPHESSNINAFRYEPEDQKLYVKFQDKYPGQNGPVYSYEGVPNYIFNIFQRGAVAPKTSGSNAWHTWRAGTTPSHGAAMAALIKAGGFPYQRLT